MSELKELALRNIGRNLVNFQKIEGMLKLLLSHINYSSPVLKLEETVGLRKKNFKKQSLGNLTKEYLKTFNMNTDCIHEVPEDSNDSQISVAFTIHIEECHLSQHKKAFSFLVSERNRLVHHMLGEFNSESEESCKALISDLDEQNEMVKREYANLQKILKIFHETREELFTSLIQQPDGVNGNKQ